MAAIAREREIKVYEAYTEELPFEDGSFDFVLMVTILCFLADPFQALSEATRVLKPEGRLIIGMIDRDSPPGAGLRGEKGKEQVLPSGEVLHGQPSPEMAESPWLPKPPDLPNHFSRSISHQGAGTQESRPRGRRLCSYSYTKVNLIANLPLFSAVPE
jgi:SAM-dependent methyltransferase